MPRVVVLFHDGELLFAETPEITFDLPVIEADVRNVDSNAERAIIPLVAVRQLLLEEVAEPPPDDELQTWDRAAFHFLDGHVLRAWVGPAARLGVHGGIWEVVEPQGLERRTLAIPYTSLKGVFRLRQWDSRPAAERAARAAGVPIHLEQMVRVLAERESRASWPRDRPAAPLLDRLRGAAPPPPG